MDILSAVQQGETAKLEALLTSGADANFADDNGYSALHWACQSGSDEIVHLLLSYGAKADAQDQEGYTPLEVAINRKHSSIAALLLSKPVDIERIRNGFTYLHACAAADDLRSLSLLLQRPEILRLVNSQDEGGVGRTPLHWAAQIGNPEICAALLVHDANGDMLDADGLSPLHIATAEGHSKVVKLFVEHGLHVNRPCPAWNGGTCLHNATVWEREDMVVLLLARGADPCASDNNGKQPIDYAREVNNRKILSLLEQAARHHR